MNDRALTTSRKLLSSSGAFSHFSLPVRLKLQLLILPYYHSIITMKFAAVVLAAVLGLG